MYVMYSKYNSTLNFTTYFDFFSSNHTNFYRQIVTTRGIEGKRPARHGARYGRAGS